MKGLLTMLLLPVIASGVGAAQSKEVKAECFENKASFYQADPAGANRTNYSDTHHMSDRANSTRELNNREDRTTVVRQDSHVEQDAASEGSLSQNPIRPRTDSRQNDDVNSPISGRRARRIGTRQSDAVVDRDSRIDAGTARRAIDNVSDPNARNTRGTTVDNNKTVDNNNQGRNRRRANRQSRQTTDLSQGNQSSGLANRTYANPTRMEQINSLNTEFSRMFELSQTLAAERLEMLSLKLEFEALRQEYVERLREIFRNSHNASQSGNQSGEDLILIGDTDSRVNHSGMNNQISNNGLNNQINNNGLNNQVNNNGLSNRDQNSMANDSRSINQNGMTNDSRSINQNSMTNDSRVINQNGMTNDSRTANQSGMTNQNSGERAGNSRNRRGYNKGRTIANDGVSGHAVSEASMTGNRAFGQYSDGHDNRFNTNYSRESAGRSMNYGGQRLQNQGMNNRGMLNNYSEGRGYGDVTTLPYNYDSYYYGNLGYNNAMNDSQYNFGSQYDMDYNNIIGLGNSYTNSGLSQNQNYNQNQNYYNQNQNYQNYNQNYYNNAYRGNRLGHRNYNNSGYNYDLNNMQGYYGDTFNGYGYEGSMYQNNDMLGGISNYNYSNSRGGSQMSDFSNNPFYSNLKSSNFVGSDGRMYPYGTGRQMNSYSRSNMYGETTRGLNHTPRA